VEAETKTSTSEAILMPVSNGWPLVAAFGFSLVAASLVTHWMVGVLGATALVAGFVGWFREVLPVEAHEPVPVEESRAEPVVPGRGVRHLQVGELGHRARLPLEIYPFSAGVRGGLVGGAVMAMLAGLYGLVAHHSIWYPVNLLAAAGSAPISAMSNDQLLAFNGTALVLAIIIHATGSALVGLLYGISLPMLPRHPILFGGILAPVFWTALLHAGMQIIDPALEGRIDWPWFVVCQLAFGLVTGFVVARRTRIYTMQHLPFAIRAGIEAPGLMKEEGKEGPET
jgi:hypothetical protein